MPRISAVVIPEQQWEEFLRSFSEQHRHWQVQLETHDLQTDETVVSHETPLRSIDLDLEDEKKLILHPPEPGSHEELHIDSVHTATTVRFLASKTANEAV
jgi:hypothetical protein